MALALTTDDRNFLTALRIDASEVFDAPDLAATVKTNAERNWAWEETRAAMAREKRLEVIAFGGILAFFGLLIWFAKL